MKLKITKKNNIEERADQFQESIICWWSVESYDRKLSSDDSQIRDRDITLLAVVSCGESCGESSQ